MTKRLASLIVLPLLAGPMCVAATAPLSISSPDGNLTVFVEVKSNPQPYLQGERLYYRIAYQGAPILRDSPMGLDFAGAPAFDHDLQVTGSNRGSHDETWQDLFGARRVVPDYYNQLTVSLKEGGALHRRMDVIFRAYNEGIAFRYSLPRQEPLAKFILSSENTGFYLARGETAFASTSNRFVNGYETQFFPVDLNLIKPNSMAVLPMLVRLSGGPWLAILEADLRDYAGMYLAGVPGVPDSLTSR